MKVKDFIITCPTCKGKYNHIMRIIRDDSRLKIVVKCEACGEYEINFIDELGMISIDHLNIEEF